MPELSLQHIDQISRDISREEISFSHLLDDLIDHVCCDVEYEMQKGKNFTEAYKAVKEKMGPRRVKEIQEETLYLVDTKYRNMKNTMKISGVAGTIMYGFAALFKIQHWPLAGVMMSLGAIILALVFLPSALGVLWKETHNRKRVFLFVSSFFTGLFFITGTLFKIQHWPLAGWFLSLAALSGILFFIPSLTLSRIMDQENKTKRPVYILGALGIIFYGTGLFFKIQHWPSATILMIIGVIILCVFALPLYTWLSWKDENHVKTQFIFILIGFVLIVVPGAMINLNLEDSYSTGYFTHQEQQQTMFNYRYNNNEALLLKYRDSANYPKMEQLHNKTKAILSVINEIQVSMVEEVHGKPGMPVVKSVMFTPSEGGNEIQYQNISQPFITFPVNDFLLPGSSTRHNLEEELLDYKASLTKLTLTNDLQNYIRFLEPSLFLPDVTPKNAGISLMSGLHSLELLKNSVLIVESYTLTTLANNN